MVPIKSLLKDAEAYRKRHGRPLVTLSYAQSLDGSIAARRGHPLRLSGKKSLILTHQLRAAHSAILVGIGTILADNPRLSVRLVSGTNPQPIVLDSHLRTPPGSHILERQNCNPWIATIKGAAEDKANRLRAAGARIIRFHPGQQERVPLPNLLEYLAYEEINSLMVEGGSEVITAFLTQRLVDALVITIAPTIIGGLPGIGPGHSLPRTLRLKHTGWVPMENDIVFWGQVA